MTADSPPPNLTLLSLQYHSYPDAVGGAWGLTYEVNKRLVQRGFNVHCITCKPVESLPASERIEGIHYHRIRTQDSKGFFRLGRGVKKKIHAVLKEGPIDLVHIHNPLIGYLALKHPALRSVPRVYHFHSSWYDEEKINREAVRPEGGMENVWFDMKLAFSLAAIRRMERTAIRACGSILFLSQYSREHFLQHYPMKNIRLRVIPGGVDVDEFHPADSPESLAALRKALEFPVGRPLFLTVRRLEPRMGLKNLIVAAEKLRSRSPELDFQIWIAGKGSLRAPLKALIEEKKLTGTVRLLGLVPRDTLPSLVRSADLFILPTQRIEGFGLATVEALASGVPVLGTPVGGTVEILKALDPRLLLPGTSADALSQGMESYLKNPKPFSALKEKCRQQAVSKYSWEKVVDLLEEEFRFAAGK